MSYEEEDTCALLILCKHVEELECASEGTAEDSQNITTHPS